MQVSRFPCRVCGQSTEGLDSYVVCLDCADAFEHDPDGRPGWGLARPLTPEVPPLFPLSPDEIEARLKHLLNDW